VTSQATEIAAGADGSASSALVTSSAVVTSTYPVDSSLASTITREVPNKKVQPPGTTLQAGADQSSVTAAGATYITSSASEATSAQDTAGTTTEIGAAIDPSCVDDRPTEVERLLKLKTPHDHKWTMTGKKCEPRPNADTAPRFVAYWSQ